MKNEKYLNKLIQFQKELDDLSPYASRILDCQIKIQKARFIMNPRFSLTSYIEKKCGNSYLQAKVYWPNKNGVLVRSLSLSLGNMINYPLGTRHPETINEAKKEIQEILIKKFGNTI